MKKYIFIFKTQIMSNLQYIINILVSFFAYFIMIFICFNLWKYMYSDPSTIINGYSFEQMLWYLIMTEILWMTLKGKDLCRKISNDVRTGSIAYKLNKPFNYVGYCLFGHLGEVCISIFISIILGLFTGFILIGEFPDITFISLFIVILTSILAIIISILLIVCISLFSFFIEDASPFYWVYSKFILVLGVMFPIEFFPSILQTILNFSPIYVINYGPAKLLVDFSYDKAISVIIAQVIYIGISFSLSQFIYQKGVKKINVNGG